LSSRQKRTFVHVVIIGGHNNVVGVERDERQKEGVNVSGWTKRRVLKQVVLSSKVKQKKPNFSLSNWVRVIFLDERKINHFNYDGHSVGFAMSS